MNNINKEEFNNELRRLRNSKDYRIWREKVLIRDNYTCQRCHKTGVSLEVHHIKDFLNNPDKIFDLDNGVTLCFYCHRKTDSYMSGLVCYWKKRGIKLSKSNPSKFDYNKFLIEERRLIKDFDEKRRLLSWRTNADL